MTGTGGTGGINFVGALRFAEAQTGAKFFFVCTDHNPHFVRFSQADVRFISPRHDSPEFVPMLLGLAKKFNVEFFHPHPSSEARVVSENRTQFDDIHVKTYLSRPTSIMPNKLEIHDALSKCNVPVPETLALTSLDDVDHAFSRMGGPLWIRAKRGAGGRLALRVETPEEAKHWVQLNTLQKRAFVEDFILQEYLPGRDLAFDSLWFNGKLITSYARERLEYFLKHTTLSGITGTPTIARTLEDKKLNRVSVEAIKALDPEPHGFFSVDVKEDAAYRPVVTEVDGKWHTTAPLWGHAFAKALDRPELNLAHQYLMLGLNGRIDADLPAFDLFPGGYYLIRQLDAGVILEQEDRVWRIV